VIQRAMRSANRDRGQPAGHPPRFHTDRTPKRATCCSNRSRPDAKNRPNNHPGMLCMSFPPRSAAKRVNPLPEFLDGLHNIVDHEDILPSSDEYQS
jgi:hypothetical protein